MEIVKIDQHHRLRIPKSDLRKTFSAGKYVKMRQEGDTLVLEVVKNGD